MAENRFKQKSVKPAAVKPIQEKSTEANKPEVPQEKPERETNTPDKPEVKKQPTAVKQTKKKPSSPSVTTSLRLPVHIVVELDRFIAKSTLSGKKRTKTEVLTAALTEYFDNH